MGLKQMLEEAIYLHWLGWDTEAKELLVIVARRVSGKVEDSGQAVESQKAR